MKLTYWVAIQHDDNKCYNLRAKTKKELLEKIKEAYWNKYDKPKKVTIEYKDSFDLMRQCLGDEGYLELY